MADICVMGLGYVGLPTASLLANAGFKVLGVDINQAIVDALNRGETRLDEAGLATLVSAAVKSGNLVAKTAPEPSGVFVICVPTPVTEARGVDLAAVEATTRAIAPVLKAGNLVILESTSPIGTTRNTVGKILAAMTGLRPGTDFMLCYAPERVLPGNTVGELVNNDRIVGGMTPEAAARARAIYERFSQGHITVTDDLTAEMCKLMENTFRDVNIALANTFARIAEDAGVDVWKAVEYANRHPRVNVLKPGPGAGGHCIPVDPWFLVEAFPAHAGLLREARGVNDGQPGRLLARMMATGKLPQGAKIAVLGAAYKADIDDARESPALLFVHAAAQHGFRTAVHDPHVRPGDYHGLHVTNDLDGVLREAAAAVLITDHKAYREMGAKALARAMPGRLIADARNWLDHNALRAEGFAVVVTGIGGAAP